MERIVYSESALDFLFDLVEILFNKKYFSYYENAESYVIDIFESIENNIDVKRHRKTPKRFLHHGKFYITIQSSKRTTWYVFFEKNEDRYYIDYIINNHTSKAAFLRGL